MTFEEVGKIICSYGFYKYCDDTEENNTSRYLYPGIDRLAIHIEIFTAGIMEYWCDWYKLFF